MATRKTQVTKARARTGQFASTFDPDLALAICERIAEGETLSAICAAEGMPDRKTFRTWVVRSEELRAAYAAAREVQAHSLFEETLDITRELRADKRLDNTRVNALRVALDNLRWAAGKLNPREYGDRSVPTPAIAIQINTGLDLGRQDRGSGPAPGENLYTIQATIVPEQQEAGGSEARAPEGEPHQSPPAKRGGRRTVPTG